MFNKIKCLFGYHDWWTNNKPVCLYAGSRQAYVSLKCCIKCGTMRAATNRTYIIDTHAEWRRIANLENFHDKKPKPDERLMELKELVDNGKDLDLENMDIDVQSFINADKVSHEILDQLKEYEESELSRSDASALIPKAYRKEKSNG